MKNKILTIILSIVCVTMIIPSLSHAGNNHTESVTYESSDSKERYQFEKNIKKDGKTYQLVGVDYEILEQENELVEEIVTHTEKSEFVVKGTEHQFAQSIEVEGVEYKLEKVNEIERDPFIQDVAAYTDYEYVVTSQSVPQTKSITVKNEKTGLDEIAECRLSNVSQIGKKWVDSYIYIQFKDYDSTSFNWQGMKIANKFSSEPLAGYEQQLLESVGLTNQTGQVKKTYWSSEPYLVDGVMCRDARADILKEVPVYRANYGGQIQTPLVTKEAIYSGKKMIESNEAIYTIRATATYEIDNTIQYVVGVTVFIFLIIILAVLILFVISKKKKGTDKNKL